MLHTLHRSAWHSDFSAILRLLAEGDELCCSRMALPPQSKAVASLKACKTPP